MPTRSCLRAALIALIALCSGAAHAGRLRSIDPALAAASGPRAPETTAPVIVPASFLSGVYLYRVVVESSDSKDLTLGSETYSVPVRLTFDGSALTVRREGAGASEAPVRTFPARTVDAGLEVDVSRVAEVELDGRKLDAADHAPPRGVRVEKDLVSWAQQQTYRPEGGQPVTLGVRYWIWPAPAEGYETRAYPTADGERVGILRVYGTAEIATRWRPGAPVRVHIHSSVPEHLRESVRRGTMAWAAPLKAATGQPMVTIDGPDAPPALPGTPGRLVVYWHAEDPGGFVMGAQGVALNSYDPRTGEIVGAQVHLNGPAIENEARGGDPTPELAQTPTLKLSWEGGQTLEVDQRPVEPPAPHEDAPEPDEPPQAAATPEAFARGVEETTIHEIGHALGLEHNFKASADLANLRQGELTTSVMDYMSFGETPPTPGPYDEAALMYSYAGQPVDVMKTLLYATDRHFGLDPDALQFDHGEPLRFSLDAWRLARRADGAPRTGAGEPSTAPHMLRALVRLRRFVNSSTPERSQQAFDALLASLGRAGEGAAAERRAAYTVLHSGAPLADSRFFSPPPYVPLTAAQEAAVAAALSAAPPP